MKNKLQFLVTVAYWGTIFVIVLLLFRFVVPPALPFLFGFAVAAIFHPPVSKISKAKSRWFATLITVIPFWGILLFLLWKIGALIYGEAAELLKWIQTTDFQTVFSTLDLPFIEGEASEWLLEKMDALLPTILDLSQKALMKLLNLLLALPNAVIFCFAMVVSSVLLSVSYPNIEPFFLRQLPARFQAEYYDIKDFLFRKIFRFLKAHGIMFLINYAELLIGLFLLKSPYPLILAAVISLADLLPYVGMASILVPWGLIQWLLLSNSTRGIGLIVLAIIVSVVHQLVEPRIVGKTIGLSALATLVSIYFGMKLMGISGVFIFPLLFLFFKEWNDSGRLLLWKNEPE
ncbi:MAG: AI-2E family transporter [Clostridia bacterium]|nr:AI-2E family transporter [Clostridia bacterium]